VARKQPINAEIPPSDAAAEPKRPEPKPAPVQPATAKPVKRPHKPIPGALKAVAGLVVVAVVFLLAAVLGGGDPNNGASDKPAPVAAPPPKASEEKQTPTAEVAEELGYPTFATNNTTRVGGSDPASTAAGVALAVFPSTTVAQRPAAVAIADEGEWQAALAAAVLMAAPVQAPLLLSSGGELPDAGSQALAALDPQGSSDTNGAQAFAIGVAVAPDGLKTTRVRGSDPAAAAVAIAALREKLAGGAPKQIVLAPEDEPGFAMPAAAWAARSGDPVLFSGAGKLPPATLKALARHPKVPVFVLGPSSAISSDAVREAAKVSEKVRRVSGEDPAENAIALARYSAGDFGWNINDPGHGFVVARSDSPLDAALAAPLSASGTWGPLLLSEDADTLPSALREYLLDVKPGYTTDPTRAFYNHVWVIGDQEAIDVNQQAEIDQLAELAQIGGEE
jgi:hypothetical protein